MSIVGRPYEGPIDGGQQSLKEAGIRGIYHQKNDPYGWNLVYVTTDGREVPFIAPGGSSVGSHSGNQANMQDLASHYSPMGPGQSMSGSMEWLDSTPFTLGGVQGYLNPRNYQPTNYVGTHEASFGDNMLDPVRFLAAAYGGGNALNNFITSGGNLSRLFPSITNTTGNTMPVDEYGLNTSGMGSDISFPSGEMTDPIFDPNNPLTDSQLQQLATQGAGAGSGLLNSALNTLRQMFPNLGASDLTRLATAMIGNNQVEKSTNDIINRYMDRVENAGAFSPGQRGQLANIALDKLGTSYLTPEMQNYLGREYMSHPYQDLIDTASGGLHTLYTNPMSNPIMAAVANLSAENASRRSAAGRGLNSGSYQAELQDSLLASLGSQFSNLANPMNTSFTGATNAQTQARTLPIQAYNALSNADTQRAQQANVAGTLANSTQAALAGLAQQGMHYSIANDSTRTGNAALGNVMGGNSPVNNVANTINAGKSLYDVGRSLNLWS